MTNETGTTMDVTPVAGALVEVEVDAAGRFSFRGANEEHVVVAADGDLHVKKDVGADAVAVFRFELASAGRFIGIELSREGKSWNGAPTMDTGGAFIREGGGAELPFKVAPSTEEQPERAFVLTQVGSLEPLRDSFHYRIHVGSGGGVHSHDPKIYNEGDGPGGG